MKTNLSDGDVAGLLRIAGEVGELAHDMQLRRTHILTGLLALVGGCGAVCVEMDPRYVDETGWALPGTITLAGMFAAHAEVLSDYLTGRLAALDPCTPHLLRRQRSRVGGGAGGGRPGEGGSGAVTIRRCDVVDRSWFDSAHFNEIRRPRGIGESLYATVAARDGGRLKLTLHRGLNDRPFTVRDRLIVHTFNEHLAPLYGGTSAGASAQSSLPPSRDRAAAPTVASPDSTVASLPARVRPVLQRLLAGDAEKQAALALGLSPHTVHAYTKLLYRTFGVNSRGELLARFVVKGQLN